MSENLKRANEYLSPETISELVKDDLIWHYKHLLTDIFKSRQAYIDGTLERHDREDHEDNVHFAGLFHDILGDYYGVDVSYIRSQVLHKHNESSSNT